jgi:hypothetical protein
VVSFSRNSQIVWASARLRHIAGTTWSAKCHMNMRPLYAQQFSESGVRKIVIATVLSQLVRFKASNDASDSACVLQNDK